MVVRAFVALPLAPTAAQALGELVVRAKRYAGGQAPFAPRGRVGWRWVTPANMHVTLRFLGDVPAGRIAGILAACQEAAEAIPPLSLEVSGIGAFPGWRRPAVVWAGVAGDLRPLARLAARLEAALVKAGFGAADRPFYPHVTLARCRPGPVPEMASYMQAAGEQLKVPWLAGDMVLFRSILSPQGPSYLPLGCAKLAGSAGDGEAERGMRND